MRLTRKRSIIALGTAVVVALAVAIPTVIASSKAGGPVSISSGSAGGGPSPAVTTLGSCSNTKTAYASDNSVAQFITSTAFVQVTGMSVNFTTAGSCAEITFSSASAAAPGDLMYVHALVDGTECLPGQVQFAAENAGISYLDAHSYTFVCAFTHSTFHPHHTATVEMRSTFGVTVASLTPTMIVRYG